MRCQRLVKAKALVAVVIASNMARSILGVFILFYFCYGGLSISATLRWHWAAIFTCSVLLCLG
jgi:hypothetical protein